MNYLAHIAFKLYEDGKAEKDSPDGFEYLYIERKRGGGGERERERELHNI